MQRTVTVTKINFIKLENGELKKGTEQVAEKNIEKAVKTFSKKHAGYALIETVSQETHLYILDDDIFFKFARISDDEEAKED